MERQQAHQQELEHLLVDQPGVCPPWLGSESQRGVHAWQMPAFAQCHGLDGRGGAALYASVEQWLAAYERTVAETTRVSAKPAAAANPPSSPNRPRP